MTLPAEIERLRAELAAREAQPVDGEAELRNRDLLIEKLKHQLAGMRRDRFGSSSEILDQLHLRLEDEEIAISAVKPKVWMGDEARDLPMRRPLPDNLPRHEQVLMPGEACRAWGGMLCPISEDVTEELEHIPGRFIVSPIVRPRLACRCCRENSQRLNTAPISRRLKPILQRAPKSSLRVTTRAISR